MTSFVKHIALIVFAAATSTLNAQPENGYQKFFYDNGQLSSEGTMKEGQPVGLWKTYYENGNLKSEGFWNNGKIDSTWVFYYETGVLKDSITYDQGIKNGPATHFTQEGFREYRTFYRDNRQDSLLITFHPNGQISSEANLLAGRKHGTVKEYAEDGRLITNIRYDRGYEQTREELNRYDDNGNKTGKWLEYHPNGELAREVSYKNGQEDGIVKEYNEKGNLIGMEKYESGIIQENAAETYFIDLYREYFPDGSVRLVGGKTEDGRKQGVFREYDQKGNIVRGLIYEHDTLIAEGGIVDEKGIFRGDWKYYYITGELKGEGAYKDGVKDGLWVYYHINGELEQKGKYSKGKPSGDWKWYYANGQLEREEGFRGGLRDGMVVEYDTIGNVMTRGEYLDGMREGEWYYNVGDHIEKGAFVADLKDGLWEFYYKNEEETLMFEGEYDNGLEVGKHVWYHPNGKVELEGKYRSGLKTGDWKKFDENGQPVIFIQYRQGREFRINGVKIKPRI